MNSGKSSVPFAFLAVAIILIGATLFGVSWYRASLQADVYRREGIEISTWEVFWGSKPGERSIHMKEKQ